MMPEVSEGGDDASKEGGVKVRRWRGGFAGLTTTAQQRQIEGSASSLCVRVHVHAWDCTFESEYV